MKADYSKAVDVNRLRKDLFPKGRIPLDMNDSFSAEVFNTKGESLGRCGIRVLPSSPAGDRSFGHRMFIQCPGCGYNAPRLISAGRLHQHYAYKHPSV